ncbi:MAG: PucR family transcriptional regulator ligand-binding domain-containing protein [Clostridiaceae bacterium]|jgi:purine catabolism regulator|nr:PucR family transcriptional regulator ligand-binding domain-containing protein [Clostridiaceae bacterium]
MSFTLTELLTIPIMQQANVRTAFSTLSFRPVESISVIEIPVENFVRKNELVLSTAIGCSDNPEIFKEFVRDIFESEAAALTIATGRHIKNIPAEVIQVAEELNFPIIEIPWEIRFADITEAVLAKLHDWHVTNLKRSEDLQNRLLNLFLNDSPLSNALELVHKEIENPLVVIDNFGKVKGKSRKSEAFLEALTPYIEEAFSISDIYETVNLFNIPEDSIIIHKIQSSNKLYGYILLQLTTERKMETYFKNEKENIIRHIISTLMLWFQKEEAVKETEIRFRDDFIWSIAKGEVDSWENMSLRARSLGYNLSIPYVCIAGLIDNANKSKGNCYEQWLCNNINNIKEQVIWSGKYLKLMTMVTYQQDRLIIFLEAKNNQIQQNINKFLDLIESRLKRLFPDLIVSWGIGENNIGIRTFHESFIDAGTALDICYSQEGPGHRSTYARTGIYRVLRMIDNNDELKDTIPLIIGELVKYDKQRGLDLINTLKIYIQNRGNVSQTARALNLHRQSLLYRLKKIESLTNRSLSNPDDLFLLDLSIKLWMYSAK